ncbi:hypothetical protein Back11_09870 [Paenibacillus baekrokdamisoli]|uniref:Uncharacterized protein n=1 Tax=Paenibacillus baekrokdamisoli TaxID=1712516 RepID=A0A3G9IN35_9BACL|nr:hypothetical protein [Paenibacillus baekrokdamisoli]BBH19642.1 hypothetical protein Back11_09870 [Paenibacillus baekrokdamisoli]
MNESSVTNNNLRVVIFLRFDPMHERRTLDFKASEYVEGAVHSAERENDCTWSLWWNRSL